MCGVAIALERGSLALLAEPGPGSALREAGWRWLWLPVPPAPQSFSQSMPRESAPRETWRGESKAGQSSLECMQEQQRGTTRAHGS